MASHVLPEQEAEQHSGHAIRHKLQDCPGLVQSSECGFVVHNHGDTLILNCSSVHPAHERTTWDNDAATEEYGAVTNIYKVLNKLQLFLQLRENSQPQFILLKISVSHWVHVRNFIYI